MSRAIRYGTSLLCGILLLGATALANPVTPETGTVTISGNVEFIGMSSDTLYPVSAQFTAVKDANGNVTATSVVLYSGTTIISVGTFSGHCDGSGNVTLSGFGILSGSGSDMGTVTVDNALWGI